MLHVCHLWQIIVEVGDAITLRRVETSISRNEVPILIVRDKTPRNKVVEVKVILFFTGPSGVCPDCTCDSLCAVVSVGAASFFEHPLIRIAQASNMVGRNDFLMVLSCFQIIYV